MIVPVPKQRNSGDENEAVKARRIPEAWDNKPAKLRVHDSQKLDRLLNKGNTSAHW